jgi:thiol-disulfide isomerase/thioredoxin
MSSDDVTRTAMQPPLDAQATRTQSGDSLPTLDSFAVLEAGIAPAGFVLDRELGRGGMGVVFLARQVGLNRPAAIKMLRFDGEKDAKHVIRFLAEAEAVAAIHHPYVIQVYEFGEIAGRPFLAMEYLSHGSLVERIRSGRYDSDAAAKLIAKIADAVQAAHDLGIVHRDVKPGNILFDEHDEPKLTDFGLAKRGLGAELTQTQTVMGTPAYMAPEQAAGRTKYVGPAADIYALGVILFECLCGKRPFEHPDTLVLLRQVVEDDPPSLRKVEQSIPRDLELICDKCLAKDPKARYQTAGALADDLRRYLAGEPVSARPHSLWHGLARWMRKHPATAAASIVGLLMLCVLLVGAGIANRQLRAALADAQSGWKSAEDRKSQIEREQEATETQRKIAEEKRALAEKNEREAKQLRADVEQRAARESVSLHKQLDDLDDLIFKFDTRLANLSGTTSVRRELLNEIARYNQKILLDRPDDPAVLRQAARVQRGLGDVYDTRDTAQFAETAYNRSITILRKLVNRFPEKVEYRDDLALAIFLRGYSQANTRPRDAAKAFEESVPLFDKLATEPNQPRAGLRAARAVFRQANALEEAGDRKLAIPLYRDAVDRQEKLLVANPMDHELLADLAQSAMGLGLALELYDATAARDALAKSLNAARKAAELSPQTRRYATRKRQTYNELAAFYERNRRDADFAALALDHVADYPSTEVNGAYNTACYLALASKVAAAQPDGKDRAESHAKAALEYLGVAVDRGFTDRVHLRLDPDLDSLRDRADFQAFLATVDKRFPGKPVGPAELVRYIRLDFADRRDRAEAIVEGTATVAEQKRSEREFPDFGASAKRVFDIAAAHPGDAAALEGLVWIVRTANELKTRDARKQRDTALAKLESYVTKPEFLNACPTLMRTASPAGDKLLSAAFGASKDVDVRGLAALALGFSLAKQAENAPLGSKDQADLGQAAEVQLDRVLKEFANVVYGESTLGEMAKAELHRFRALSKGRAAREIDGVDLDGQPLKLSQFKGKVVLLDFWANWCGFCRAMYPHEREMVETYKSRPFVLLGVNGDEELAAAKRAVEKERLNWRSWWDGGTAAGRIREEWQVEGYPRVFLIDHKGVIREVWDQKPDNAKLDAAVEKLVKEAERDGAK